MTAKQIASLVSEAIALDNRIAQTELLLRDLKARLVELAALTLRDEAGIKDPVGSSQTFTGELETEICRVNFPGPRLISGIWFFKGKTGPEKAFRMKDGQAAYAGPLQDLAGDHWNKLFVCNWKPAKGFRELAPVLLGPPKAEKLIALCEDPSGPRVSFETKAKTV